MELAQNQTTARSWDSFKDTLIKVLDIIKPKKILEYGPGVSTSVMVVHPGVETIDSVEHDIAWYEKWRWQMPDNVNLIFQPNIDLYPLMGSDAPYDFIFIDGKVREICLFISKSRIHHVGVVMLHDAERISYKPYIDSFEYKFFTDDGHTVTLTDNYTNSLKLESLYE